MPRASLLKKEIDSRVAASGGRFSVHYVVDKASSPSWTGGVGYVTQQMLAEKLPPPQDAGAVAGGPTVAVGQVAAES